jgi:hypothetical protein
MKAEAMEMKGTYKLTYSLDKETKELTVAVELLLREGMGKPFQNLYVGNAVVNGQPYDDERLEYCVNAKMAAERIGHIHRDKLVKKYKKNTEHKFKIKKEELK